MRRKKFFQLCLLIFRHALLRLKARSFTYLMYCSLPRSSCALPDEKYAARNVCLDIRSSVKPGFFARIIPDTRPSGSLRSRPVDSWRTRRFFALALPDEKYAARNVCLDIRSSVKPGFFARIIPDTRPSGSLRSRPVDSWRTRRFFALALPDNENSARNVCLDYKKSG